MHDEKYEKEFNEEVKAATFEICVLRRQLDYRPRCLAIALMNVGVGMMDEENRKAYVEMKESNGKT